MNVPLFRLLVDLLAGEGRHGGIEASRAVVCKPFNRSRLAGVFCARLSWERLMEWVLETLAIAFVAIAAIWFVVAKASAIFHDEVVVGTGNTTGKSAFINEELSRLT
jgi:hypothetical protein